MCKVEKLIEPEIRNGARPIYYEVLDNGCHICKSHRHDRDGYFRLERFGKEWLMHRYILFINNVEIPVGMHVRHKCDNPFCINKNHLELGTPLENMREKILRNRQSKIPQRLTKDNIQFIMDNPKMTIPELARKLNVCHSTIVKVKRKLAVNRKMPRVANKEAISGGREKQKDLMKK